MRHLNSDVSDEDSSNLRTPYVNIIAVGIIQFLLSLLILCYGVLLMQFVIQDVFNLKSSLWGAVLFITTSKITNPWVKAYCKHLDLIKQKVHKRNIIIAVLILSSGLVLLSFFETLATVIIFYGVFGGVFSSIISVHLNFATADSFKDSPQLFNIVDHLTKSFCLLLTPRLVLLLTTFYRKQTFLILGGCVLNIIPVCLLVRTKKNQKVPLCKFPTVAKLSIEMKEIHTKEAIIQEPSSSSEEDEDDTDDEEEKLETKREEESDEKKPAAMSAINMRKYYETVGVSILPDILEVHEEDEDINEINSKRLSRISAILQGMKENNRRDSNFSVNNLFQPDEYDESEEPEEAVDDIVNDQEQKRSRCFSVNSNTIFKLKQKKRRLKSFCYRNLSRCGKAFRTPHFYPAVISSSITTTLSMIVFAGAPYLKYHSHRTTTLEESTFLLIIMGFTWIFFLAAHPFFDKLSSLKTNILFLVGLSILGLSLFIVHEYDYNVLFALTFGLGHGIVSYTEKIANENFFGKVKWKLLEGALEISTGVIVILIYLVIYFVPLTVNVLFLYAFWIYIFDVGLWAVAFLVKKIVMYVKNTRRYNIQR